MDATGSSSFAYAADGQLLQHTSVIDGASYTTQRVYDAAGRLEQLQYPGGLALRYRWLSGGRLLDVLRSSGGAWTTVADAFLHQPASGQRYAWRFAGGLLRGLVLDTDGRLAHLATPGVQDLALGHDATDRIVWMADSLRPALAANFGYDAADRLTSVQRSGDAQGFGWDAAGNRSGHSRAAGSWSYARAAGSRASLAGIEHVHADSGCVAPDRAHRRGR